MKSLLIRLVAVASLALILIMAAGCSKRENPAVPADPAQGLLFQAAHQYDGITGANAIWSGVPSRRVDVYAPPGYRTDPAGPRYPVLYMLPGFDGEPSFNYEFGNENYFQISSIAAVADRLIANGEIKPMLIVMPDASVYYGGSFYANSTLAGKWEDMMANELVSYVDATYHTIVSDSSRAISGHSSGGYGAMRIVMKFPGKFQSVSAIDAPLAFDGGGNFGGLKEAFGQYITHFNIASQSDFDRVDSINFRTEPLKVLLFSMAATYSPGPKTNDSLFGILRINFPFDYQNHIVQSVWDQWLANDLYSWLDDNTYKSNLMTQNIYLESSDHDVLNFNKQTVLFEQKLTTLGIPYVSTTFSKYPTADAQARTFLYDRLEYILKFHNQFLKDRDGKY